MFDLGDLVPLTVTVRDADGAPTNASTVTLTVELPDGTTVTPTVTNPPAVTGVYAVDYSPTMVGLHRYTFTTTGPKTQYGPALFEVASTSRGIVSLDDVKNLPSMNIRTTTHDETLRRFIEAATSVIERHTGNTVVREVVTETVMADWRGLHLTRSPIISITTVADSAGTAVTDGVLDTNIGLIRPPAYALWWGEHTVTYVAGMTTIPAEYSLAALIIVEHLWQTQRGTMSAAARPGGMDDVDVPGIGYAIPRRALQLLGTPGSAIA
jgi:hypothetical protein